MKIASVVYLICIKQDTKTPTTIELNHWQRNEISENSKLSKASLVQLPREQHVIHSRKMKYYNTLADKLHSEHMQIGEACIIHAIHEHFSNVN